MASHSMAALRQELDRDGCAYGQVSRERITHLVEATAAVEHKLNYVLAAVGLQLLSFVFAVLVFLLYHLPTR
jgi:hypothetical protein